MVDCFLSWTQASKEGYVDPPLAARDGRTDTPSSSDDTATTVTCQNHGTPAPASFHENLSVLNDVGGIPLNIKSLGWGLSSSSLSREAFLNQRRHQHHDHRFSRSYFVIIDIDIDIVSSWSISISISITSSLSLPRHHWFLFLFLWARFVG